MNELAEISSAGLKMDEDGIIQENSIIISTEGNEETQDNSQVNTPEKKRRKSSGVSKWSKYTKKYRSLWDRDPILKDWILRAPDDDTKAICRYCQCVLRAHKSDLMNHVATTKHQRSEKAFQNGEIDADTVILSKMDKKKLRKPNDRGFIEDNEHSLFGDFEGKNFDGRRQQSKGRKNKRNENDVSDLTIDEANADGNGEMDESGNRSTSKWTKYPKRYRTVWERDPKLKEWIMRSHNDDSKVVCRFCHTVVNAQKSSLLSHMATIKHKKAVEKGEIITDLLDIPIKKNKKKIKKKVYGPGDTCFIVESEQPLFGGDDDDGVSDFGSNDDIGDFNDHSSEDVTNNGRFKSLIKSVRSSLIRDVDYILSNKKEEIAYFASFYKGDFDEYQVKKIGRICLAHLSRKYQIDSAIEAARKSEIETVEVTSQVDHFSSEIATLKKQLADALCNLNVRVSTE